MVAGRHDAEVIHVHMNLQLSTSEPTTPDGNGTVAGALFDWADEPWAAPVQLEGPM